MLTGESSPSAAPASPPLGPLLELLDAVPPGIEDEIHPRDGMFVENHRRHYFSVGASALRNVRLALGAGGKADATSILDVPCGYGRVLRFLRAAFPAAQLTACDIVREGVDFCAQKMGARPVYSKRNPLELDLDASFDFVWCGSLLTHLEGGLWPLWLRFFERVLVPGGTVVFTTHGQWAAHRMRTGQDTYGLDLQTIQRLLHEYDDLGFAYGEYPFMADYGISFSSPRWVAAQLHQRPSLQLVCYLERGWDAHHDVVACVKSVPASERAARTISA